MSGERWRDPTALHDLDPRRREWFETWCDQELARRGVQWGDYAREHMRGQFTVEEG